MKFKKTAIIIALLAIMCTAIAVPAVIANSESWSNVELSDVYAYGETLTVPERTLTAGGSSVTALSTVAYPNGKVVRGKKVNLDEIGNYTLRYYANVGSKQYATEESFTVKGFGYRVDNSASSLEYGLYTDFGANSTGLKVKLANGDKLTFTKLINLSALTQKDALIKFFIMPEHQGTADFDKLTLTLTDSADSSKYVNIDVNRGQFSGSGLEVSWVMAGANGQDMVGLEEGKMLHVNDDIGTSFYVSFVAQDNSGSWSGPARNIKPDKRKAAIYFDYASKAIYADNRIVSDLDSADYYKDLWNGFTSDKVRLTISASGYASATANFCITELLGTTAEDFASNAFADNDAPVITLSEDYENMPRAEVGTAYPVPAATAYDDYAGNCDVTTEVFYGTSDSKTSVGVTDGSFTPDKLGAYTIVYTAKDGFGNTTQKQLFVIAVKKVADIVITKPTVATNVELGTFVNVPDPEVEGGTGKITVEKAVIFNGERTVITDGFRPEVLGTYTVEFTATDYIGKTKTETLEVGTKAGDKPMLVDSVYLPPVYIAGGSYVLPELYVNDYTSGKLNRVLCDVEVKDLNGTKTYKSGSSFVPAAENNGDKTQITYFVGANKYASFNVPVIIGRNDKTVYMANYMNGEDVQVTDRNEKGARYTTGLAILPQTENASWTFANALVTENASITLGTLDGTTNFSAFNFRFIDSGNGKAVLLTAEITSAKVNLTHGGATYALSTSIKKGGKIAVEYENGKLVVTCNESSVISIPVTEYEDGKAFQGFASAKVYISVQTTETKANARYMVYTVADSIISYRNQDNKAPSFTILGDSGGKYSLGTTYTINRGVCGDVFAPNSKATLTVTAPDGSFVKAIDGTVLKDAGIDVEYEFMLEQYGNYTLDYTVSEENWVGKSSPVQVTVSVVDEEAPVITFKNGGTKEAQVGDVIRMPEYTVTDNVSSASDITVSVVVVNAYGRIIILEDGSRSIKCEYAGKYTFIVYALDGQGNSSSLSYEVIVK